jgi:Zn-ribbon protein, possibly nucleic acid-binding
MVTVNELDKLRDLQDILTEKIHLEHEIQEIPKQLGALEEAYNRTRKLFIEKNVEHEKVKSTEEDARIILNEAEAAREKLEEDLGLSADEIKEKIRLIQVMEKKLRAMEAEFEESIDSINQMAKEILHGRVLMKSAKDRLIKANLRLVVSIAQAAPESSVSKKSSSPSDDSS